MLLLIPLAVIFIIFKILSTEPKSEWEKYIKKELERNPDYIDWLKEAHSGKHYRLGLKILARTERDRSKVFYRLLRKIRG